MKITGVFGPPFNFILDLAGFQLGSSDNPSSSFEFSMTIGSTVAKYQRLVIAASRGAQISGITISSGHIKYDFSNCVLSVKDGNEPVATFRVDYERATQTVSGSQRRT